MLSERDLDFRRSVLVYGERFSTEGLDAASKFFNEYNIEESLHLTRQQGSLFMAYFAHYWILKKHDDISRYLRDPHVERMQQLPVFGWIIRNITAQGEGVKDASEMFLELAKKYAVEITDNSHFAVRNAANILSSIMLEGPGEIELNQKLDRAFSRLKLERDDSS